MNLPQQAAKGSQFPLAEQEACREREEEARKNPRLQLMISMVMSAISQDPNLTVEEASELAAGAKRAALAMFPDKELAFDLLYKPRLQRLMKERFRLQEVRLRSSSPTEFFSVPAPSTLTSITSPATTGPTPAGVPLGIRSPGNKVIACAICRITTSSEKMKSRVLPCCRTWPLTRVSTPTPAPTPKHGSISSVTTGPTGQNVSKPLARVHCPSLFCRSRAVTSFTHV